MAIEPIHLLSLTREELGPVLGDVPAFRRDQILQWIYTHRIFDFHAMSNLPLAMRTRLAGEFSCALPECLDTQGSVDSTRKYLFRLSDGNLIETVLIPASPALYGSRSDRRTLCVSSQVGCAYGCKFCASGLDGWKRHLSAGEIVSQLLAVEALTSQKVSNIVFMGMGEPFANYQSLMQAIRILNAPWGVGLGARHMTVSTSGLVPAIRDFADQSMQVRLAISLHGATDEVRSKIMPVNARYPVAELMAACAYFESRKKQHITFEYILIDGVNDSLDQARALAAHALPLRAKINLIPYNSVEGLTWARPPEERQEAFLEVLQSHKVSATLRREKGHDIAAACGQLRLRAVRP